MSSLNEGVQAHITGFWSTVAPEYEAHPGNVPSAGSPEHRAWVEAIKDLLPPAPADVLDIATGTGFVALTAASLGHRVTGIDLSDAMLDVARAEAGRRGLAVAFRHDDAVAPELAAGSYDAIISRHFIWTLREPLRASRNWLRLLRPGGCVIAIDGFWFAQTSADDSGPDTQDLFARHYTMETRAALPAMQWTSVAPIAAMFKDAGFAQVVTGDLGTVHALADVPPSSQPWYVVVAHRPL
jgi:SAM-dependent methyltransferase